MRFLIRSFFKLLKKDSATALPQQLDRCLGNEAQRLEKRAAVALRCHCRRTADGPRNRDVQCQPRLRVAPSVGVRRHDAPGKRALIDDDLVEFLALGLVDGHQVQAAPLLLRGDEVLLQQASPSR